MWARVINIITGLWIIAAPTIFQFDKRIANNDHILGPLIMSVAVISISESVRSVRYVNSITGIWLVVAPWILNYNNNTAIINSLVCGILTICCSLIKGKVENHFGGGWRSLFSKNPRHLLEANNRPQNS